MPFSMKNRSFLLLTSITLSALLGCKDKQIIQSKNYAFDMKTWGLPGSLSFEAFLYNTDLPTYPPERRGGVRFAENTLYILKHDFVDEVEKTDTLAIVLNGDQVDSLYALAYHYLSDFTIDNEVEEGKVYKSIQDGTSLEVSLEYDGKLMKCSQFRLEGISHSSPGGKELIVFINNKLPENFRLY